MKLCVLPILLALACAAGVQAQSKAPVKEGGTLRIVIGAEPGTFDVARLQSDQGINAGYEVLECLTTVYKGDGAVVPNLATSWSVNADATSYTFELRPNVKFHDGTPFNAAAVKANFDRVTDPNLKTFNIALFSYIKSTTVLDDLRVRVDLSQPLGFLPAVLASYTGCIASPASFKADGNSYEKLDKPVGTGPYVFKSYTKSVNVLLERNESYWGDKPAYKRLEFKIVPDAAAREAMLRSGGADVIFQPPPSGIAALQKDPNIVVYTGPSRRSIHIGINTQSKTQPALRDVRVRQAINYAIDKKSIIQNVLFGLADETDSPVPKVVSGYCRTGDYSYNPQKAKQLLKEAGATNITVKFQSPTGRYLQDFQAAQAIAGNLRDVGINVEGPTTKDFPAYVATLQTPPDQTQNELSLFGLSGSYPEAGAAVSYFVSSRMPPTGFNLGYFNDPKVDVLIKSADAKADRKVANQEYCEAEKIVWEQAPWAFLWIQRGVVVHSKKVAGIKTLPNEMVNFNDAYPVD